MTDSLFCQDEPGCPFCGGRDLAAKPVWVKFWFIACNDCKAAGPVAPTPDEAWRAWRGRQPLRTCRMNLVYLYDEEGVEGIECDECGWCEAHDWGDPLPSYCTGCQAKVVA